MNPCMFTTGAVEGGKILLKDLKGHSTTCCCTKHINVLGRVQTEDLLHATVFKILFLYR